MIAKVKDFQKALTDDE